MKISIILPAFFPAISARPAFMRTSGYLPGLILVMCTLPVAADIQRCTEADGSVSFSDTPCGEETTAIRKYRPAEFPDNATGNSKRERLLRAFEVERRQAQQQADKEAARQAERDKKCRIARDQLRSVNRAGRIYNVDENGDRVVQSDENHAETKRQAEDYVGYWCD
jgi:hypothetical protein